MEHFFLLMSDKDFRNLRKSVIKHNLCDKIKRGACVCLIKRLPLGNRLVYHNICPNGPNLSSRGLSDSVPSVTIVISMSGKRSI